VWWCVTQAVMFGGGLLGITYGILEYKLGPQGEGHWFRPCTALALGCRTMCSCAVLSADRSIALLSSGHAWITYQEQRCLLGCCCCCCYVMVFWEAVTQCFWGYYDDRVCCCGLVADSMVLVLLLLLLLLLWLGLECSGEGSALGWTELQANSAHPSSAGTGASRSRQPGLQRLILGGGCLFVLDAPCLGSHLLPCLR